MRRALRDAACQRSFHRSGAGEASPRITVERAFHDPKESARHIGASITQWNGGPIAVEAHELLKG